MMSQFGEIFNAAALEREITAVLKTWFPTYLREAERQFDLQLDSLESPNTYTTRRIFDSLPGEELPKCVVVSPGMNSTPEKRGGGSYDGQWTVGVGVAIAASTEEDANDLAKVYAAVTRTIVLQQVKRKKIWLGESYDDLPIRDKLQQYKSGVNMFGIWIDNVVTQIAGPDKPDLPPDRYAHGIVETVIIDKQKLGV